MTDGRDPEEYQEAHVNAFHHAKFREENWFSMSMVVEKWDVDHEAEHGPWAAFVGFERALLDACESLDGVWHELDAIAQGELYAFVCELLRAERAARSRPRP